MLLSLHLKLDAVLLKYLYTFLKNFIHNVIIRKERHVGEIEYKLRYKIINQLFL